MTTTAQYAPPGPEFMNRISTATWTERGPAGVVCRVLLTPAEPRLAESVEAYRPGLLGIAQGLGLRQGDGPRRPRLGLLLVQGIVALDYGHPSSTLNVRYPGEAWYAQATRNGSVHVAVGLTQRPAGGAREAADEYLATAARAGELWTGTTAWRRSIPAAWLQPTT